MGEATYVEKKFRQLGWLTGSTRKRDLCQSCSAERTTKPRREKIAAMAIQCVKPQTIEMESVVVEPNKTSATALITPRQMTIADRRKINEKLSEVYMADAYMSDWSDERLSREINVPRAWVAEIRELLYGPAVNEHTIEARQAVKAALDKMALIEKAIEGLIDELGKTKEVVKAAAKKVDA